MSTIRFKTNIKCGGCVAAVTPHLNAVSAIERWQVDLQDPARVLTVESTSDNAEEVKKAVSSAGYTAEVI